VGRDRELLRRAVREIAFEFQQLVDVAAEPASSDGTIDVACLESALLHVRNLLAFFESGEQNWITVKDYLPKWSPPNSAALRRLRSVRDDLNAYLSHLTWDRVTLRDEAAPNPAWSIGGLADDVLTVFAEFVQRLREVDAEMGEWLSAVLATASITLRGAWPEILPPPAPGSPLSVFRPNVERRERPGHPT
jgi:hypothetical protein